MAASPDQKPKQLYEFGPFRVDPDRELLLRGDQTVPLTPKTFQILLVLVRHSKEVVAKDDLMKMVWPDTFVEEANLSRNIFLLRKALGETPQDHQYIVTVPGRGYRFAEDVQLVPDRDVSIVAATHAKVEMQVRETNRWPWIIVAAILVLAVAAVSFRFLFHRSTLLSEKDTVVLADFTNSTGDPVFDGTLRQGLSVQLEQSPFLALISDDRIQHTLGVMEKPAGTRLTPEVAREICERAGSTAFVDGSITSLGSHYVLGLTATNCHSGEVLDQEQVEVARKEDVLKGLDQIAGRFRTHIGESLAMVQRHDTPLEDATTSSLEALKDFSAARSLKYTAAGYQSAVPLLKHAIELDPNFAMAHAFLSRTYGDSGESALSAESARKAYELRQRASERERFFIDVTYDRQATGNLEKAHQTLETWALAYPRDRDAHALLSGFSSQGIGKYEEAIEEGRKAIALDPYFPAYTNVAYANIYLGRPAEAESLLRQAAERKLEIPDFILLRYYLAFLKRDTAEMSRQAALGEASAGAQDWMLHSEAFAAARAGHLQRAREISRRAVDIAQQAGQRERAGVFQAGAAVWESLFGNAAAAKQDARQSLELSRGRDVEYAAAFALAEAGDPARAQALANDLETRFPEDTSARFSYLPTLRALVALKHGEPARALELLQPAATYEQAVPGIAYYFYFGGLYSAYVRGEAYLAAHQGAEAAAEFQKLLDHPGIMLSDPAGTLVRLQLARAYAQAGDTARAKVAYTDFFTLMKDADPNLPILQQAQREQVTGKRE